tara:strand:- start:222 stop:566 length:345 start_codon:yes stop_codon:yes gene_type:complete
MNERKAIVIGLLTVNIPVLILMVCPLFLLLQFNPEPGALGVIVFFSGFVFAWLWWSLSVPKWRLWAYSRVQDINALKTAAVSAGLTWPDGSFFEKTEIKSAKHAAKERSYERNA